MESGCILADVFICTYSEDKDSIHIEKAAPGARGVIII